MYWIDKMQNFTSKIGLIKEDTKHCLIKRQTCYKKVYINREMDCQKIHKIQFVYYPT